MQPGEAIDWEHGIFFLETASGQVEGWQIPGDPPLVSYSSSPDQRFVRAFSRPNFYLVDRVTGFSIEWDSSSGVRLVGEPTPDGRALFERAGRTVPVALEPGLPAVDGLLDAPGVSSTAVFAPSGDRFFAIRRGGLHVVDAPTGESKQLMTLRSGGAFDLHTLAPVEDGFLLLERASSAPKINIWRYDWEGNVVGQASVPIGGRTLSIHSVLLSPGDSTIAWEDRLPYGVPDGAGGRVNWGVVGFADA